MNMRDVTWNTAFQYMQLEYLESYSGGKNNVQSYIQLPFHYDLTHDSIAFETEHELTGMSETNLELYNVDKHALNWGYVTGTGYSVRYDSENDVGEKNFVFTQEPGFNVWRLECSPEYIRLYVNQKEKICVSLTEPLIHSKYYPLTLFGVITDSNPLYSSWPLLCKKKYFKIWKNGQLSSHLIPVLDMFKEACMYDIVNQVCYHNLGETPFKCGPILSS